MYNNLIAGRTNRVYSYFKCLGINNGTTVWGIFKDFILNQDQVNYY